MIVFVLMFMPSFTQPCDESSNFLTKIFKGVAKSAEHYANKP